MAKLYIVSGRIDTDVLFPRPFPTREDAEKEAKEIIYESARQTYQYDVDDAEENPSWETLEKWADDNLFEFEYYEDEGKFYDGNEITEVKITEHNINL